MKARLLAFVIWAAVAASVVFWVMRVMARPPSAPSYTTPVAGAGQTGGDLSRLLGMPKAKPVAAEAPQSSRFQLLGVVAPKASVANVGVALIAIDGKPARAFRVGSPVDGDWVVQSVHAKGAALGPRDGAPGTRLTLPPLPVAATGTLPAPVNRYSAPAAAPQPIARPGQIPQPGMPRGYPGQPGQVPRGQAIEVPVEQQDELPAEPDVEPEPEPGTN